MKTRKFKVFFVLIIVPGFFLLSGCAAVEQTIYLGDVNVRAPIMPPPEHVNISNKAGSVTISPRITFLKSDPLISASTDDQYGRIFNINDDTTYRAKSKNLDWNISRYTLGADIDIRLSDRFSIFGGLNYSEDEGRSLIGGNIGIGIHKEEDNSAIRLDLGLTIQDYDYTAITIVHTKTTSIFGIEEYWDIYGDRGRSTNINPFATLTFNSSTDSGLFNWFITGGFFTQNLLGFEPGTTSYPLFPFLIGGTYTKVDTRSDVLTGFLYFNPGIAFTFSDNIRLLVSARILSEVLETNSNQWIIMPSAQIDFQF